jgi:hypothetical protein
VAKSATPHGNFHHFRPNILIERGFPWNIKTFHLVTLSNFAFSELVDNFSGTGTWHVKLVFFQSYNNGEENLNDKSNIFLSTHAKFKNNLPCRLFVLISIGLYYWWYIAHQQVVYFIYRRYLTSKYYLLKM